MTDPLLFLVVDDCPGRYDEFFRLCDAAGHRWVLTHDPELFEHLVDGADVVILDHDMPKRDGRVRARFLAVRTWTSFAHPPPVIISSETRLPGAREEMAATLEEAGFAVLLCPADHHGVELEWLAWARGALAMRAAEARR